MKKPAILLLLSLSFISAYAQKGWISLFNGKDLSDWTVKISKHDLNDNFANTFRAESGLLKVSYDGYTEFNDQFGHIFYKKPFSAYLLRLTYRFTGEQVKGGPGWAIRNSGAMLHGQAPGTMHKNQDFPISIEAQLLGGDGTAERHTSNLCTPGTNVFYKGKLFTAHCLESNSKTYPQGQWVTADFLVLGDSVIKHIIEGQTVLEYTKPQIGGGNVSDYDPAVKTNGTALTSGYISLQSESHPIEFKTVKLYDLAPYIKDEAKLNKVIDKLLKE